ncbi:MAG: ABC transporter permease [Paracoccaceae bacterium]
MPDRAIAFVPRTEPSRLVSLLAPVLAVALTILAGGVLFAALGHDPVAAIVTIFHEPIFGEFAWFYRPQLLVKGAPLVLIATGLAIGFRAGVWNIGAEGQYILGALCGAGVALALYPLDARWIVFPLAVAAGALGGLAWGLIPAILRVRFGANEILVSLLLVYVAEQLLASAALGLLRNPDGMGFPGSRNLGQWDAAANPELISGTGMHWGVVAALIAVILAQALMTRHMLGYRIRLAGQAPRAARFAGVEPGRLILLCLGLSGLLAGLAGVFEVTGPAGQITIDFNVGYGFTAIIVAFLGRLHPLGILLAGALMALTYIGGEIAQSQLGLPLAAIQIFQGMLLFFLLAVDVLTRFRIRIGRPGRASRTARAPEAAE